MYRIAVCDDEMQIAEYIAATIRESFQRRGEKAEVYIYSDTARLRRQMSQGSAYDALLLDIDMPEENGIDFCKKMRNDGDDTIVVFISNKETLVYSTFEVKPFRFIRKNFFREEQEALVDALIRELEGRKARWLRFENAGEGTIYSINIDKISYCEAANKDCRIYAGEDVQTIRIKFSELMKMLAEYHFIQVHRSILVNPLQIYRIDTDQIVMVDGSSVPISRRRREQIKDEYFQWSMSR